MGKYWEEEELPAIFYNSLEEYAMNIQERDELLIRLDERTNNILNLTEKQESHLDRLNTSIQEHTKMIIANKVSIKWIIRILGASGLIGGTVAGILKAVGVY